MPESKRSDPKRRSPASRPARAGDSGRDRPRGASPVRREPRAAEQRAAPESVPAPAAEPIRESIAEAADRQSDQRLGSAARRAAILAAVLCVLTLTIAGPVRTYFGQRTEMNQLAASAAQLRSQIADLQLQKAKLADPAFIAAQARERLGFVMPGDIPYQVQLPATAGVPTEPGTEAAAATNGDPWYTSLWHTIADAPHNVPTTVPGVPPPPAQPGVPPPPPAQPGVSPPGG
jgi:cell division protein FtsB